MNSGNDILNECKKLISEKLGWGDPAGWTSDDFENLHEQILQETGISLSESTLRRIWGRVKYEHLPSRATLNALAKFAGYTDWRTFEGAMNRLQAPADVRAVGRAHHPQRWLGVGLAALLVVVVGVVIIAGFSRNDPRNNPREYKFSSQPLTRSIPNTVVFRYDASASPTDSVYIQQSWDARKRFLIDRNAKTFSSIYYEPGFFQAKLIVGTQVVKELPLLVPSLGWMAYFDNGQTPVYLDSADFIGKESMQVSEETAGKYKVSLEPAAPVLKYFNVGNFKPVPIHSFSFRAQVKNNFSKGAGACQFTEVYLMTNGAPIILPLSARGCVSELGILCVDNYVSGKKADLSMFGVNFNNWVDVGCQGGVDSIRLFVGNRQVYTFPAPAKKLNIVGMGFFFRGMGSVRNVELK